MKLSEHTEKIRLIIDQAFRNKLGRLGFNVNSLAKQVETSSLNDDQIKIVTVLSSFETETGNTSLAFEKLVEELTFTLFNRIAALKVMEAHTLHPEIITKRSSHGDKSFAHLAYLEQNPDARFEDNEGLIPFFESQLEKLSADVPLFSTKHPFHLLPTSIELNSIIDAFNEVENDANVEPDIWKSDDVLGWLYESYNTKKKKEHKESGDKTEYHKVSLQSQVYTPRWVVKFLVDNSLGKLYLEMYPDSRIKNKYRIANAPVKQVRERKPLIEIKLIDPAPGSGNFILYGFDLFYDLYLDQIENYNADYDESKIPKLIIENNLYGIDIDDRAVQIAQLGLYIKAKRKVRSTKIDRFHIVSSDFLLPEYPEVKHLFENGNSLSPETEKIVVDLWADLQQAHKYGSLLRLEEKLSLRLHGLVSQFEGMQIRLFAVETLAGYDQFRDNFFANLKKAVVANTSKQGINFLNTKTADAINYLELISQKYDVAVANPPYTDSSDFGPDLKRFIDSNYKQPHKFNTNLYAAFIKRCYELTAVDGFIGMIHPHTFMFIKTFEDVRKYIIDKTYIDLLVDYGLDRVNLFGPGILLDATWYVLSKKQKNEPGLYFNITANQQERAKQDSLENAYNDAIDCRYNPRVYTLPQDKLKIIEGWPFIYWISDSFREKFKEVNMKAVFEINEGLKTSNNIKYFRSPLEIEYSNKSLYRRIFKGGPFNKWFGNIWLVLDYNNQKYNLENESSPGFSGEANYFRIGLVCPSVGAKGPSFRLKPVDVMFSNADLGIFFRDRNINKYEYALAVLNSKLTGYINEMLNPTVNITVGDIQRIPYIEHNKLLDKSISRLSAQNIFIKEQLCRNSIIETNFEQSPLSTFKGTSLKDRVLAYLNYENEQLTQVLINEAIINELIFKVYELSDADQEQVEAKMGKSIGALPVIQEAKEAFINQLKNPLPVTLEYIQALPVTQIEEEKKRAVIEGFSTLYQSNNDLEEFCIKFQINPINVWYWFKASNILPQSRTSEIALEFLADALRTVLMEDNDGIIPLVGLPGEPRLLDRLEQHCIQNGFTPSQFMQLDNLVGRPLNEYLEHHFFKNLSDHLNLFMYLPKTPFIWHLSSGEHQGLEVYIIIYKWNRDSLFKLKSQYISNRVQNLEYRLLQLHDSITAQAQNEKEKIRLQLNEITLFTQKIDELIAEGYDPKLDDGVGKNIAPLQQKKLLRTNVLNATQLPKYLNADW